MPPAQFFRELYSWQDFTWSQRSLVYSRMMLQYFQPTLKNYFLQVMEICIPNAVVKVKKDLPWLNRTIKKAIQKWDTLYWKLKWRNCTAVDRAKYNTMRNQVVYLLRESKKNYFSKLNHANVKEFWKTMKLLNHDSSILPTLQDKGISILTRQMYSTVSFTVVSIIAVSHWQPTPTCLWTETW